MKKIERKAKSSSMRPMGNFHAFVQYVNPKKRNRVPER